LNIALRADDILRARVRLLLDMSSGDAAMHLLRIDPMLPQPLKFGCPAFFSRRRHPTA